MDQRMFTSPGIWANDANTVIPTPPVAGLPYRNTSLSPDTVRNGQSYGAIGNSADWNQVLYQQSGLIQSAEQYGIMPYSPLTTYGDQGLCLYTDGKLYQVKAGTNPPPNTPPTDTTYWKEYLPDLPTPPEPVDPKIIIPPNVRPFTLYVDYSAVVSGDGLTAETPVTTMSKAFEILRAQYTAANDVNYGGSGLLYMIDITGPESGVEETFSALSFYNMTIAFNAHVPVTWNMGVVGTIVTFRGCEVSFTGDFTVKAILMFSNCYIDIFAGSTLTLAADNRDPTADESAAIFTNCEFNCYGNFVSHSNTGACQVLLESSKAYWHKTSNVTLTQAVEGGVNFCGVQLIGSSLSPHGNLTIYNKAWSTPGRFGLVAFLSRFMPVQDSSHAQIVGSMSVQSSYASLYSNVKVGGLTAPAKAFNITAGSAVHLFGAVPTVSGNAPVAKGDISGMSYIYGAGVAETSWPGGTAWVKAQGGAYYA